MSEETLIEKMNILFLSFSELKCGCFTPRTLPSPSALYSAKTLFRFFQLINSVGGTFGSSLTQWSFCKSMIQDEHITVQNGLHILVAHWGNKANDVGYSKCARPSPPLHKLLELVACFM